MLHFVFDYYKDIELLIERRLSHADRFKRYSLFELINFLQTFLNVSKLIKKSLKLKVRNSV